MKGIFYDGRGSILMETVLVIPLYLVILSGIFWVGDLALLRSKSTFFDRFAAWSSGNRFSQASQSGIKSDLEQNFLLASHVGDQQVDKVRTAKNSASSWAAVAGGATTVSVKPPVWTQGWRRAGAAMMEANVSELQRTSFRSREIDAEYLHSTLMRTGDTFRDKATPRSLGEQMTWMSRVYMGPWPTTWTREVSSPVTGGKPCLNYDRHAMYVLWSE